MPRDTADEGPYQATEELEDRLRRERQISLTGGRYKATVARTGSTYEAWTDSLPFVYGKPARSLQAALDSLEEEWRQATGPAGC